MSFSSQLLADIDGVIAKSVLTAAGVSGYVLPIVWMFFAIALLIWSVMVMEGKVTSPISGWLSKGIIIFLIIIAAGVGYQKWVAGPILNFQKGLGQSIIGIDPVNILDAIELKIDVLIKNCFLAMNNLEKDVLGIPSFPALIALGVAAFLFMLAGGALTIVALVNLVYAKLGLGLILMVGPFFIACLAIPFIKNWFNSWLNTCLYFIFLYALTIAYIVMCVKLADVYLENITGISALSPTTASGSAVKDLQIKATEIIGLISAAFRFTLLALILGFMGLELRTIASSITGGSGGSIGHSIMSAARSMKHSAQHRNSMKQQERFQQQRLAAMGKK